MLGNSIRAVLISELLYALCATRGCVPLTPCALRLTVVNLRYALCAMLPAVFWYVKGEGG